MKKSMLFMAALCCVFMIGVTFNACEKGNNDPELHANSLDKMDPLLEWGADYAAVQAHMDAKKWYKIGNDSLEYWKELKGWHRWYWVADSLTEQYLFETQDGKNLFCVECYCYDSKITFSDAQKYLIDKNYTLLFSRIDQSSNEPYEDYLSEDEKTRVRLNSYNNGNRWFFMFWQYRKAE